jgi:hypothetical protein
MTGPVTSPVTTLSLVGVLAAGLPAVIAGQWLAAEGDAVIADAQGELSSQSLDHAAGGVIDAPHHFRVLQIVPPVAALPAESRRFLGFHLQVAGDGDIQVGTADFDVLHKQHLVPLRDDDCCPLMADVDD